MDIGFEITGDRDVGKRFDEFPETARNALEQAVLRLRDTLYSLVETAEPSRTGALRASTIKVYREGGNYIVGGVQIGSDFAKAAALNYGAHRSITVRAHTEELGHIFSRDIPPMEVTVEEYQRRENLVEMLFLQGAVDTLRDQAMSELDAAMAKATQE